MFQTVFVDTIPIIRQWSLYMAIYTFNTNYGCVYVQSEGDIDLSLATEIQWISGFNETIYGSNVIDITRNRQVIQVYSSLVRSSDLKIANQNNNLLTTMIIDDPEADYINHI